MQSNIRDNYKQIYAIKMDNQKEMDKFTDSLCYKAETNTLL